jgi:hypothetical protein
LRRVAGDALAVGASPYKGGAGGLCRSKQFDGCVLRTCANRIYLDIQSRWRVCARPAANVSRYVTATNVDIVARPRVSVHPVAICRRVFFMPIPTEPKGIPYEPARHLPDH